MRGPRRGPGRRRRRRRGRHGRRRRGIRVRTRGRGGTPQSARRIVVGRDETHAPRVGTPTPRSARRRVVGAAAGMDGEMHQQLHPHSPLVPSSSPSPTTHTRSPHRRAGSPSPNSPQYRTASPRVASLALDSSDLARRHTTPTPTASPRRAQFGLPAHPPGSPLQRATSPARTERGDPHHHMRQRSKTEPYGIAGELYGCGMEREQQQRREEERERGHARKSSAYAALSALSGLGVGHPAGERRVRGGSFSNNTAQGANPQGANGPPTPGSTPPLSADVRDESLSPSESEDADDYEDGSENRRRRRRRGANGKLLTPPATPPRCSLVVVAGSECACVGEVLHAHEGEARPTFNARKASAQCRQLEGYVSFAAVEGLGEPPSPGPEGDFDETDAAGKRKRGSLGSGIAGFWKGGFWGAA
ncbi:hypothetical protein MSAN_00106600 [Mycena sanguinolenta]|uniref:Uncharacterized protein n=1 Tax=Mycena sanguinolenta TaxID=230812 RepID=A0A8H6ZG47_9AGAR|nr:hypothetical protein MSAN_00106600 [Mycena sanguinolenta]